MKTIKNLCTTLPIMIALALFVACSSSGDDEKNYNSGYNDNIEGVWYTTEDDWIYVITNDMITQYELMHSNGYSLNPKSNSWLYSIEGDKIILNSNEAIAYSLSGNTLKFAGDGYVIILTKYNGTLDQLMDHLNEGVHPEDPTPQDPSTSELLPSEQQVQSELTSIYYCLSQFEYNQQTIESAQLRGETFTSSSEIISSAWENAYSVITRANLLLSLLKDNFFDYDINRYITEATALRSFVFYQMTNMWGDVPYYTEPLGIGDYYAKTDKGTILSNIQQSLNGIIDNIPNTSDNLHFGNKAAQILLSEISMVLGENETARSILSAISSSAEEDLFVIKSPDSTGGNMKVYNTKYVSLLLKEFDGMRAASAKDWFESENVYGVWAALKRLSYAKDLTGCDDNHLVLPIPDSELLWNPMITQNPGY